MFNISPSFLRHQAFGKSLSRFLRPFGDFIFEAMRDVRFTSRKV